MIIYICGREEKESRILGVREKKHEKHKHKQEHPKKDVVDTSASTAGPL